MASFSDWVVLYYLLVCVVGGFFVINLFLAVIFGCVSLSRIERAAEDMEARTAPSGPPEWKHGVYLTLAQWRVKDGRRGE